MADIEQNPLAQHLVEKGRQEGLQEKAKKIAMRMLQEGYSLEAIQHITELGIEELQELQEPAVGGADN